MVDDEEAIVLLVPDLLTRLGYHATAVTRKPDAVDQLAEALDRIFQEMGSPGMGSGLYSVVF